MKRLRHPIRAIREPFGTAGLIVACLALVLAMGGAAVAAKGGLTGKQKKEVETIAKKYAGKPGTNGATGATGPAGTAGAAGGKGDVGANGADGANGVNGVNAEALTYTGPKCENGGVEVKSAGAPTYICNGKPGAIHPGETLPTEATETGTWEFLSTGEVSLVEETPGHVELVETRKPLQYVPLSFPIPLSSEDAEKLTRENVPFSLPNGTENCPGNSLEPKAEPGFLCVYPASFENTVAGSGLPNANYKPANGELGAGPSGTLLLFEEKNPGQHAYGTFAVTAP